MDGLADTALPLVDARALVAAAAARGLRPPPKLNYADWARQNLKVADGPRAGEYWDPALTPYAVEILDCLGWDDPCNTVTVRKSVQVGLTQLGIILLGGTACLAPCKMLITFPTLDTAAEFNAEKLQPSIDASPALKAKIRESKSRSSEGSTGKRKRFAGGSAVLTGANSPAGLRSKTIKLAFADEIDEWPLDLANQGDPMKMVDARQEAFRATGDHKKLQCSTPTIKGASRIDEAFEAGDRRYFQVPCPHCDEYQRLEFASGEKWGLKFNRVWPYQAHYVCRHCGAVIEHHEKGGMIDRGRWVAECPEPGRQPSFHVDSLTSKLTTWDAIAEEWWEAQGSPEKLKAFFNLMLGQAFEERGDAPPWRRLLDRRDDYEMGTIPPGGLVVIAAADVQRSPAGIYVEVAAWGDGLRSWSIWTAFLPGDPADETSECWSELDALYEREWPDAYGNTWKVDALAVDSGYATWEVYSWCRSRPKAYAVDGRPGWTTPPIGTPSKKEVSRAGKKKRRGAECWPVGTWTLKATLYANLRKPGRRDGAEIDPPGYCRFSRDHDEAYFRQLTAEYLKDKTVKGRKVREWEATGANHFHDCRIYMMAMVHKLGLHLFDADRWQHLAELRGVPPEADQADMAALWNREPGGLVKAAAQAAAAMKAKPAPAAQSLIERMAALNRR